MPTRICLHPTCPDPATHRGRCSTHAQQRSRAINRAGKHIYNTKRWRILRSHHLFEHPLCAHCQTNGINELATDVHHITDLAANGDPWNPQNLQALCHPCHSRITREGQTHAAA